MIFAIIMETSLPFKRSSSTTNRRIKLICALESRSAFPCLLALSDPRISTRTVGNIVLPLLATDEITMVVAEFVVPAVCISGWWKNLHWLPLTISLHWCPQEQFDTLWSPPARLRQLKHPWFSLTALKQSLGFIAMKFEHCSIQWAKTLHSQHLWFAVFFLSP